MMRITRKQKQAFVTSDAEFARWYVDAVMKPQLPQFHLAISEQGKLEMVTNGRIWARLHGFSDATAQAHFITLMWKIGPGFFVFPGFAEIARDTAADDQARVQAFYDVDPELAAQAILQPDDRYWYPFENGILGGNGS